jgi:hypothetical protein
MAHMFVHDISVHRTGWVYESSMVGYQDIARLIFLKENCSSLITVYIQLIYTFLEFIQLSFSFFLFLVPIQPEIILYSIFWSLGNLLMMVYRPGTGN